MNQLENNELLMVHGSWLKKGGGAPQDIYQLGAPPPLPASTLHWGYLCQLQPEAFQPMNMSSWFFSLERVWGVVLMVSVIS